MKRTRLPKNIEDALLWIHENDIPDVFLYIQHPYPRAFKRKHEEAGLPVELKDQNIKLSKGKLVIDNIDSPFHGMTVYEYLRGIKKIYEYRNTVVYFLYDGDSVVYVGSSDNFIQRMIGHRSKKYDRIGFMFGDLSTEYQYQMMLKPKYNKVLGKRYIKNPYFEK